MIQTRKVAIKQPVSAFYPIAAVIALMIAYGVTNVKAEVKQELESSKLSLMKPSDINAIRNEMGIF